MKMLVERRSPDKTCPLERASDEPQSPSGVMNRKASGFSGECTRCHREKVRSEKAMVLISAFVLIVFLCSLLSRRLERTFITAPMLFAAAGAATILLPARATELALDLKVLLPVAESGLVMTLFTDASRINLEHLKRGHKRPDHRRRWRHLCARRNVGQQRHRGRSHPVARFRRQDRRARQRQRRPGDSAAMGGPVPRPDEVASGGKTGRRRAGTRDERACAVRGWPGDRGQVRPRMGARKNHRDQKSGRR